MAQVPKPDLDEATLQIARRMLATPPKPHGAMKLGKAKASRKKRPGRRKRVEKSR